jgi:hypothetical protein
MGYSQLAQVGQQQSRFRHWERVTMMQLRRREARTAPEEFDSVPDFRTPIGRGVVSTSRVKRLTTVPGSGPDRAKTWMDSGCLPLCYLVAYAETQLEITIPRT